MRRQNPKRELSPEALKRFKMRIWQMPWVDRNEILIASVIDREGEALASALAMTALITRMSEVCGTNNRVRVAESLRNAADTLDHELQDRDEAYVGE
jgi:DNA-directed RNA polymerase subunit H (RpoH/RPB5)